MKSVADRLNTTSANTKAFHTKQTIQQSQLIDIDRIKTDATFRSILPINEETKTGIIESMKENGFDDNFPILCIKAEKDLIVIDGHTRLQAAKDCGIDRVPAKVVPGLSEKEDLIGYIIAVQINRRNLSEADYIKVLQNSDVQAFLNAQEGKYRANVAKFLGISTGKAQYLLSVVNSGNEETIEEVVAGEKSVHQAYAEINPRPSRDRKEASVDDQPALIESEEAKPVHIPSNKPDVQDITDDQPNLDSRGGEAVPKEVYSNGNLIALTESIEEMRWKLTEWITLEAPLTEYLREELRKLADSINELIESEDEKKGFNT